MLPVSNGIWLAQASRRATMHRPYHRFAPATELRAPLEVGHTLGLRDAPGAYEREVLAFLGPALLD